MSLTDEQIDTIARWVDAGAPEGNPKDLPPPRPLVTDNEWQAVRDGFGPPDLVVRSSEYTMPARHQDVWYRPMSDLPLTEPRWARMVEIRPTHLKGRKILHHAIAYLVLNDDTDAVNTGTASIAGGSSALDDLVSRRPQLMEWAIGKGYDLFREGTGKLLLPGEKISWDQHIHAMGEEVTAGAEIGIWLYPKGQEPKKRSYLMSFTGVRKREYLDIPPNSISHTEGFTVLKENTLITNFQPHFHLRGKAMQVEAILPDGTNEIISYVGKFNFNWMTNYIYDDDAAPVYPKGTLIHVSAWHDNTRANPFNPDPDQWVGLWGPNGRRDGARMDERGVSERRGIPRARRGAQGHGRAGDSRAKPVTAGIERQAMVCRRRPRRSAASWLAHQLSEPRRDFGTSVTGAFEGWFANPDGSRTFLVGYLNRNAAQALDIPIGPDNRIEPGGPDLGQPTHFLPGRRHGMFTWTVPKDFTPEQRLTWTIVANGQTTSIPLRLQPGLSCQPVHRRRSQEHAPGAAVRGEWRSGSGTNRPAFNLHRPSRLDVVAAPADGWGHR